MKKGVGRGAPGAAGVGNREAFKQMMEELEAKVIHCIQKEGRCEFLSKTSSNNNIQSH